MRLRICISLIILSALCFVARADNDSVGQTPDTACNIITHIQADSMFVVTMPEALMDRIKFVNDAAESVETVSTGKMGGYRIQVFSDNNARTAKSEARTRARNVGALFPQYPTYVVYNSPYWRLRVGNFRTREEANKAADEIKEAFPSYVKEIRIVRDRITLSGD